VTNKIGTGGVDNRPVQVATEKSVKRVNSASASAAAVIAKATTTGNGVQITDSARQLAALEQAIRAFPDVDQAKIDQIRNAIANGTYQVSPERIADKLMQLENQLSG
jgi:negative regulator of flagellin synthesis FlgM